MQNLERVSTGRRSRRRRTAAVGLAVLGLVLTTGLVVGGPAVASHGEVSLPGSNFEIDTDANLKVDDAAPSIDWASVVEVRKADTPSGSADESFGQGTKEDTPVPSVVTGGIPPNKSDLKFFGVYQEGTTASGFLHVFWSRVQEPSGTTNMDFELNQVRTKSSNGVTPVRTKGDFLLQYDLTQGGTNPQLFLSRWRTAAADGTCEASNSYPCWGTRVNLTTSGDATGSINTSAILEADSDGLGAQSARTFGEASVKLSALLGSGCTTLGSAYLKSRSSDSFTAALKDFVPPTNLDISNCGSVNIVKTDDGGAALNGAVFTLYTDAAPVGGARGTEDTATTFTCTTAGTGTDAGKCSMTNVPFGDYWVVETTTPTGYVTAADQHATISSSVTSVTLTFVDARKFKVIVLVCNQSDNTLYSSNVTLPSGGTNTKASLGSSTSPTAATLCGLGGASFGDLSTGLKTLDVNIGTTPVP